MSTELSTFATRLRDHIAVCAESFQARPDAEFNELALTLFALQFQHNAAYRKICAAKNVQPEAVAHWSEIPAVPTAAFKELKLTSLAPAKRTHVFHSSGTTEQRPSRHFHSTESLAVYETSLLAWFHFHLPQAKPLVLLTPPPGDAPHSSLVHMFDTIRRKVGAPEHSFLGRMASDLSWTLDFPATIRALENAGHDNAPVAILGTAFSFVHLLDYLAENNRPFRLPKDSRVLETGGYKNRSRALPKAELHALITDRLGIPAEQILCEYGMSELSAQAYDLGSGVWGLGSGEKSRVFHFPPWARPQIISPETGRAVAEGETGLIRVFDLANVFSVLAVQTEDLAIRRGDGFELLGRAEAAEPRGCSLMTAPIINRKS